MTERPIIFSGESVRAILENRKTLTRRVVKPQPDKSVSSLRCFRKAGERRWHVRKGSQTHWRCPFGQPGDRLWVRESAWYGPQADRVEYDADFDEMAREAAATWGATRRSPIHMPKWACRLWLEVVDVYVERLQEITEEDAEAEGCEANFGVCSSPIEPIEYDGTTARDEFAALWDCLNAKRGHPWEGNPWVWVMSFKRIERKTEAA